MLVVICVRVRVPCDTDKTWRGEALGPLAQSGELGTTTTAPNITTTGLKSDDGTGVILNSGELIILSCLKHGI